jgi:hypothetical protein
MSQENIIRMAQEVRLLSTEANQHGIYVEALERFAALTRAAENEACAALLEENAQECSGPMGLVLQANADAIRERLKS